MKFRQVHLIGIGGAGLSAIATVLLQQGYTVSGSDMAASEEVDRLRRLGAKVNIGHNADNLGNPDVVVFSSAVQGDNPEIVAAQARGLPVLKRPAWLGQMMTGKRGIAVAGTHGKTTTTAMLALLLTQTEQSPTYIIGGFVPQLNTNAAAGDGELFVIEADEYDHTFLSLKPDIAIITNIEWDHPDIYPTADDYTQAFIDFAALLPDPGNLILCGDDPGTETIKQAHPNALTYGLNPANTWRAVDLQPNRFGGTSFHVQHRVQQGAKRETVQPVALHVPGEHNVCNALAAIVAAHLTGLSIERAGQGLTGFKGTGRRFELKGEANGVTIIDDYAHHPTEIRASLAAARTQFGERPIWAVFQPHTYSRTKLLLAEFAAAFQDADHAILLDIFSSARERDDGSISSRDILSRMQHPDARHIGPIPAAISYLRQHLSPGDVLITLGAGDGYKVGEAVLE